MFCGDVNTAHEEIDLARPKENEENTGFLPEERAWIDEVINVGYVDSFRHFHPHTKEAYSYWDQLTRARDRNVGWRLDYFFVANEFIRRVKKPIYTPNLRLRPLPCFCHYCLACVVHTRYAHRAQLFRTSCPQGVLYNVLYWNMIAKGRDVLSRSLHQCAERGACQRSAAIRDTSPTAWCST